MKKVLFAIALIASAAAVFAHFSNGNVIPGHRPAASPSIPAATSAKKLVNRKTTGNTGNLIFIENKGQVTDQHGNARGDIQFRLAAAPGLNVFVGNGAIHYQFSKSQGNSGLPNSYSAIPRSRSPVSMYRMDVELVGSNKNAVAVKEQAGSYYEQFFTANAGAAGFKAHSFGRITYKDVYPHIDWTLYSAGGKLKHEFIVHAGGRVSDIKLKYAGASSLKLNKSGELAATTPQGIITENAPYTYETGGKKVNSHFTLTGNIIGYNVETYTGEITIDPTLFWSTYYGGTDDDQGKAVATDAAGNVVITGYAKSLSNIATTGAYQTENAGGTFQYDAFIAKFDAAGVRQWATYYGGSADELGFSIATDLSGNIYIAGQTNSTAGISTAGSAQVTSGGSTDGFLAKFSAAGARLWATYYGGTGLDVAYAVTTDASGNVLLGGSTQSTTGISTTGAHQAARSGGQDGFFAKFSSAGTRLWGSYFGGITTDAVYSAAFTVDGQIYIAGMTASTGMGSAGTHQSALGGGNDAIVAKFTEAGSFLWCSYFGGTGTDEAQSVCVETSGAVCIAGNTASAASIATSGAHQAAQAGGTDGFLARLSSTGTMLWSTYYGGTDGDYIRAVASDAYGNLYIAGYTFSATGISAPGAPQATYAGGGGSDAFVAKFSNIGVRSWGSYLGGEAGDWAAGIAVNAAGSAYVAGYTQCATAISSPAAFQTAYGGTTDCFLAVYGESSVPTAPTITSVTPAATTPGTSVTITGTNFNNTPANNTVYFGATKATVNTASATSLEVTIPTGATYAPVSVLNTGASLTGYYYPFFHPIFDTAGTNPNVPNFSTASEFSAQSGVFGVAIGDIDGDGKPDIAATADGQHDVSLLRNTGSGGTVSFASKVNFSTGNTPKGIAMGDIDGDGKLDIVVANNNAGTISVFRNTSSAGAFTTTTLAGKVDFAAGAWPVSVAIADLDGDGRADIAATTNSGNKVCVFRNISTPGSFTSASLAARIDLDAPSDAYGLVLADLDGDRKPEVVVGSNQSAVIGIFKNNSTPGSLTVSSFAARVNVNLASVASASCLAVGDLDADGRPDIVQTSGTANVHVYKNNGTPGVINASTFNTVATFTTGSGSFGVTLGDLNGDGKIDIATANENVDRVYLLRNTSVAGVINSSSFAPAIWLGGVTAASQVVIGDVTGDGRPEILANDRGETKVAVFTNNPLSYIGGSQSVCVTKSTTLNITPTGGTWSSSTPSVATVGLSTGIVNGIAAGTSVISYTISGNVSSVVVTVTALPSAISGASSVCAAGTFTLTCTPAGGVWSSSATAVATVNPATGAVTGITGGSATITYTMNPGCFNTKTITVNPLPDPGTISGPSTVAVGSILTLSSSASGGAWSTSHTGVATVNAEGIVYGISAGTATITYGISNGCGTTYAVRNVTINTPCPLFINTIAGNGTAGAGGDAGPAAAALLNGPKGVATDRNGNIYIADYTNHRVRKISSTGIITTVAGTGTSGYSGDAGAATAAKLSFPIAVATDRAGNLYISDYANNRIRKVNNAGIISTVAGDGGYAHSGDGGLATAGSIANIRGIALSQADEIYLTSSADHRVRKVNASGIISTIAGTGTGSYSGDGGPATAAALNAPSGLATDAAGNLYIADDANNRLRKVSISGIITTIAGTGSAGSAGDGGMATSATLAGVEDVATDSTGNIYITTSGDGRVRKVSGNIISTVAGSGGTAYAGDGGLATSAGVTPFARIAVAADGSIILSDQNHRVRKVSGGVIIAAVTGTSSVCQAATISLSSATPGGSWSSSNATVASAGTSGTVTGNAAGTATISYTVTNSCGTTTVTKAVTVNGLPDAGTITGPSAVAIGGFALLSNTVTGGTWSSSSMATATVNTTGLVSGIAAGSTTISYTTTNGCGSAFATKALLVNPTSPSFAAGLWSTYLGGSAFDFGYSIAVDGDGNVYMSGETNSSSGIATPGSSQSTFGGGTDAFLAKFSSSGSLLWATYFGGTSADKGNSLAFDDAGNVYMAGYTESTAGIATSSAHQLSYGGASDAFLAKFSSSGVKLWATYYGGSGAERYDISVAVRNNDVYIAGLTASSSGIATTGAYQTSFAGVYDLFLAKFNTSGERQWGTYYGGPNEDFIPSASVDTAGNIYLSGTTNSVSGIATAGAHLSTAYAVPGSSNTDAFLAKFNSAGERVWATYYGGSSEDAAHSVAADKAGNVYLSGYTNSSSQIATTGAHQSAKGSSYAFLVKFNTAGVRQWGTYFGSGAGSSDLRYTTGVDASQGVYLSGFTLSGTSVATSGSYQAAFGGGTGDGFLAKFNANGRRQWSTYFGGTDYDEPRKVAVDAAGRIYMAGFTSSTSAIAVAGAHQYTYGGGGRDAFLAQFSSAGIDTITGPATVCTGSAITLDNTALGGVWSSSNTSVATIGSASGIVSGLSAGTTLISYVVAFNSIARIVTVTTAPGAGAITGFASVNVGSTVTLANTVTGGTWSSSNAGIATVNSAGLVTGIAEGTVTVSYTVTNGCGNTHATKTLTVNTAGTVSCGTWVPVGSSTGFSAGQATSNTFAIDASGTPYVAYTDNANGQKATVMKYNGSNWVTVGSPGFSAGMVGHSSLTIDASGTPYLAFRDFGNGQKATVMKFNGSNWETVGSPGFSAGTVTYNSLAIDASGTPYLAYADNGNGLRATVMKFNGSSWVNVGSAGLSPGIAAYTSLAIDASGTPYLAFTDFSNSLKATVMKFNGTNWVNLGTSGFSAGQADYNSLVINSAGTPYMAFRDAGNFFKASVMKYDGSTWVAVGAPGFSEGGALYLTLAIDGGGMPYVAYSDNSNGYKATAMKYDGTNWVTVGSTGFTPTQADYTSLAVDGSGTAYVAYSLYSDVVPDRRAAAMKLTSYPLAPITGTATLCPGATITLSNATSGGTWTSGNTEIATIAPSTGTVTGIAAGTATISYMVSGSCAVTRVVTVTALPAVATITGPSTVVAGANISLVNATPGGVWSSAATSIATVGATGVVSGVTGGSVLISYTVTNSCGSTSVSKNVTVTTATLTPVTGTPTVCAGNNTALANATGGGAWSSSNISVAIVGTADGIVTGLAAGTSIISYTVSGVSAIKIVTVNEAPTVGAIAGPSSVNTGFSITLTNATPGGTWLSITPSVATITAGGSVAGVSEGTTIISYTVTNSCGSATATRAIVVNTSTGAGITGTLSVCQGNTTTLGNSAPAGTWSSVNTGVATVSAAGVVSGISAGTTLVSYTTSYTVSTAIVTVNPLPGAITGAAAVCVGQSVMMSGDAGGTWSGSNPAAANINATSGLVTGLSAAPFVVTYTSAQGCIRTLPILVNALPPAIGGATTVCEGATTTLSNTASGTWSSDNSSIATIPAMPAVLTGISAGITTITFTVPSTGCFVTRDVTVNALPSAISATNMCLSGTQTAGCAPSGGTWAVSPSSVAAINAATGLVTANAVGSATISYNVNGCRAVKAISVQPLPSTIGGTPAMCAGSSTTLTCTTAGGTWTSADPAIATATAITFTSGLVSGVANGTATIRYTLATGCSRAVVVTVTAAPAIGGPDELCVGGSVALTPSPMGGTWSSSLPAKATVSAAGLVTGISTGIATISYRTSATCFSTKPITVTTTPADPISGPSAVCFTNSITLSHPVTGGTWISSNGSRASVSAAGVVTAGTSAGTVTITYHTGAGCFRTLVVTVSAPPNAITGTAVVCSGNTTTLACTTPGGTWTSSGSAISVSATGVATGTSAGTATVSYTSAAGCASARVVTVNASPGAITGANPVCVSASQVYSSSPAGGTWSSSNSGIAPVGISTGSVTGSGAGGTATISYTLSTGCRRTLIVTVSAMPGAISGTLTVCAGNTTTLNAASAGLSWSSGNPSVATVTTLTSTTGIVTAAAAGTATISYSNAAGCARTAVVTVSAGPSAIAGNDEICVGGSSSLSNGTPGGTWSSSAPATASVTAAGVVTGNSLGTTTITYRIGATCMATKMITVAATPSAPIVGPSGVCVGSSMTLTHATSGGTWTSNNVGRATVNASGLVTGAFVGSAIITYHTGPGCLRTHPITVYPAVLAVSPIGGPATVCEESVLLLNNATAGGVWSSGNTATATVVSSVNPATGQACGAATGISEGTVTITYTNPGTGCYSLLELTVNPLPNAITSTVEPLVLTAPAAAALSTTTPGGTWASSAAGRASVGSASGVVTAVAAGTATISYQLTATGCARTRLVTVTASRPGITTVTAAHVDIYPSPTSGTITIESAVSGRFSVMSIDGRQVEVYETKAPLTVTRLPRNLAAGVYLCRFEGQDGSSRVVRIVYAP